MAKKKQVIPLPAKTLPAKYEPLRVEWDAMQEAMHRKHQEGEKELATDLREILRRINELTIAASTLASQVWLTTEKFRKSRE